MLLVHNNWLIIHVQQANKQTNRKQYQGSYLEKWLIFIAYEDTTCDGTTTAART